MSLNELIQQGWAKHHSATGEVAALLEEGVNLVEDSKGAANFMNLVSHCIGGHLNNRARALSLCEAAFARIEGEPEPPAALYLAVARRLGGDEAGAQQMQQKLGDDDAALVRVNMLVAEGHMNGNDWTNTVALYEETLTTAEGLAEGNSAERVCAVVSNNIASALLEVDERTEAQNAVMERAAHAGKLFWGRVGNWVNSERADYLLALVYNELGQSDKGRAFAEAGLKTIEEAEGEENVDEAFLHLARARACRDGGDSEAHTASIERAKALAADFDEGLTSWFEGELAKSI